MQTHFLSRVVIVVDDYLLLAKDKKNLHYFLPGGHVEYNEAIQSAAKRELKEECGIDPANVQNITLIGVFEQSWDDKGQPYHEINFVQHCEVEELNPKVPVESKESHITFEWISLDKLDEIKLLPKAFRELIPQWLKEEDKNSGYFVSTM